MMDDSKMSMSSTRHRIFEQWPKKSYKQSEPFRDSVQRRRKRNESLRAEEALEKSLLFVNNIKSFLSEMESYEEIYEKNEKQLEKILQDLQKINANDSDSFDSLNLHRILNNYYKKIRQAGRIKKKLQTFSLSNLINYDKKHTAMECTRNYQEAHEDLLRKLEDIEEQRRRLQETLVGYQYEIKESRILGDQNKFTKRLQNVQVGMNQENTVQFHYLMMYELKRLQTLKEKSEKLVTFSHETYSRFEGLSDSMNLMKNQSKEMKEDRKIMQHQFSHLSFSNALQIIPATEQGRQILERNKTIYESNMNLLARYSAETSLRDYEERRKIYANELTKFLTVYQSWKKEQGYATLISKKHEVLSNYRKKSHLLGKQELSRQKQKLRKAYLECLQYQIPKDMKNLLEYKFNVVEEIEKTMKESGMIIPKRGQAHNDAFRKYFDFFANMQFAQIPKKIPYLIENKESIDAMAYQMKQQSHMQGENLEVQKYKFGILYAQLISGYEEKRNQEDYIIKQMNKYIGERWQALPIGLESVLFNFVQDLQVKQYFSVYMEDHEKRMKLYSKKIREEIQKVQNWASYTRPTQIAYQFLQNQAITRRQPYFNFIRRISQYSPHIRDCMEEEYWKAAETAICEGYQPMVNRIEMISGVDKKHFFTCKVLCYLTLSNKKIKILNIGQLIEFYIDSMQRNFMNSWDQNHFFIEIIKMRLLLGYLENVLTHFIDCDGEISILKNILWATLRLYEVNDHLPLVKNDSLHRHIKHSLGIYRAYLEKKTQYGKSKNRYLQDKSTNLIGEMKKLPLVLGTKQQMKNYENFFMLEQLLQRVQQLVKEDKLDVAFLSKAYVTFDGLHAIYLNCEREFQPSDIVSVKGNNKFMGYLERMGHKGKSKLKKKMHQITLIGNIFRGQEYKRKKEEEDLNLGIIIDKLDKLTDESLWE